MTVEEFQNATPDELREKANGCFAKAAQTGSGDWPGLYLEAQFYLAEIERREHNWVSLRDLGLEIVVIILIGVEIVLSIIAIRAGSREADRQITALDSLNQSTSMTANNIKSLTDVQTDLTTAQKNTVTALQNELDILRKQQKQQLAEMTKQPDIEVQSHVCNTTPTNAKCQIILINSSEVAARDFTVDFNVLEGANATIGVSDSQTSARSRSVYIPLIGPRLKHAMTLHAWYPAGTPPFHVAIHASGLNISAKDFADMLITPH